MESNVGIYTNKYAIVILATSFIFLSVIGILLLFYIYIKYKNKTMIISYFGGKNKMSSWIYSHITEDMKKEMTEFVKNELLTKTWMRAQSLEDPAADFSDRADHGPMGAYDAWPAQTMDVMGLFGFWDSALDFLHSCEDVTKEGNFSQARELYGPRKREHDAPVRISNRDLVNRECSGGVSFANTVLQSFFGFQPSVLNDSDFIFDKKTSRGFKGELLNLTCKGKNYNITSTDKGLIIK